jgi:virginiamycin B lyase
MAANLSSRRALPGGEVTGVPNMRVGCRLLLMISALVASTLPVWAVPPAANASTPTGYSFIRGHGIVAPTAIAAGPDGTIWFTETSNDTAGTGNAIGRISANGAVKIFTAPGIDFPLAITEGPHGDMWFTNTYGNSIGRITMRGAITMYKAPGVEEPVGIAAGPGGAMWFADIQDSTIGRISLSGKITLFKGVGIDSPDAITAGPDGAMWFANGRSDTIGRISTSGIVSNFPFDQGQIEAITTGPDGALWFTVVNLDPGELGRITTAGVVTMYGSTVRNVADITSGPDDSLWFSSGVTDGISSITTSGVVTNHVIPAATAALGIVTGSDGAVWFADDPRNAIGRYQP